MRRQEYQPCEKRKIFMRKIQKAETEITQKKKNLSSNRRGNNNG